MGLGSQGARGHWGFYFESIFNSSNPDDQCLEAVMAEVSNKVPEEMNDRLLQTFREDEVLLALSQMYPLKAPRPDGMPALFFQKFWHNVGRNIIAHVLYFLNLGKGQDKMGPSHGRWFQS